MFGLVGRGVFCLFGAPVVVLAMQPAAFVDMRIHQASPLLQLLHPVLLIAVRVG